MKALLIIAHGSRRQASNDEVRDLTARIKASIGSDIGYVDCAFLELAEPSIPDGIESCIQQGASEVVIVPYFLSAGRHVIEDIPAEIAPKIEQYPEVKMTVTSHLGAMEGIPQLLTSLAATAY